MNIFINGASLSDSISNAIYGFDVIGNCKERVSVCQNLKVRIAENFFSLKALCGLF